jgi:hypothetical protein
MNFGLGHLGLPIVLLASLWGAVNTTLKIFEIVNERRDMVFELIDKCGYCPAITLGPLEIYFTNVVPISIGACIFLFLISYVVVSIPKYMTVEEAEYKERMKKSCYMIAALPLFALIAFVCGGVFDVVMIITSL